MPIRTRILAYVTLVPFCALICLFVGQFGANWLIETQNARQLREFSTVALRRAEIAVENGIRELNVAASGSRFDCDARRLRTLRLQVYRSSYLKDIRAVGDTGAVNCSAYSGTLEFDVEWPAFDRMLPSVTGGVRLFAVPQSASTALGIRVGMYSHQLSGGIRRDIEGGEGLAAILDIDGTLVDIMPDGMRGRGDIEMRLGDGTRIAGTNPGWTAPSGDMFSHTVRSARYPIVVTLRASKSAMNALYHDAFGPIILAATLAGLGYGLLIARICTGPGKPSDELHRAIIRKEFRPWYQPIYRLDGRGIIGAEVLARWVRPDGTIVPAAQFIDTAEKAGRIDEITWPQINDALNEMRSLLVTDPEFFLSFNITRGQLASPGFPRRLLETARRAAVDPGRITIELTEREVFDDIDADARIVAELHDLGFEVTIDDVGTGHNGLSLVQRLGADAMKVDKIFVDALGEDTSATTIVEMLVRVARERGMTLVAEGIEHEWQVTILRACGVEYGQGYLLSKPVPGINLLALYGRHSNDPERRLQSLRAAV
ncbi:MAG: EAL domain-containing protein [Rhodobiaceae bacterium]|nr:EAL domain-containing protein [Rhodobiaceae bacterium]MCC0056092.1 EAL domain-containing protein [Rhodobiaceae bacterium]